jgi:hypothetical protein
MRLTSSDEVIRVAEQVARLVIKDYAAPDRTFAEVRERAGNDDSLDPLWVFSGACRADLRALRAKSRSGSALSTQPEDRSGA